MYDNLGEALDKVGSVKANLIRIGLATMAAGVLLLATSCTTVTNRLPIITSLEADAEWIAPSGSLEIICTASDPDGDGLGYEWITTGGDIAGTGGVAIWTAPEEVGMYDITVVVDDGRGGTDTAFLTVIASDGPPPSIQELVVTAREPKYLKTTSTGYKVGKTKEYYIECIASALNGDLVYEWSCNGGEISGSGSRITWTAPNISEYVTVTVRVFDGAGNWVRKSVVFEVVDCSPCEFG